jgi:hypothetical protein
LPRQRSPPATKAVEAICVVLVPAAAVGAVGVPVSAGEAKLALRSSAVWVAVLIGLFRSEVLSTLPSPRLLRAVEALARSARFAEAAKAPRPEAVRLTAPVCPLTLETASVGVSSSCQLPSVEAPAVFRMKLLFRSVRTATSPTSAVRASIAACDATGNVSVMARAGSCEVGIFASEPRVANPFAKPF